MRCASPGMEAYRCGVPVQRHGGGWTLESPEGQVRSTACPEGPSGGWSSPANDRGLESKDSPGRCGRSTALSEAAWCVSYRKHFLRCPKGSNIWKTQQRTVCCITWTWQRTTDQHYSCFKRVITKSTTLFDKKKIMFVKAETNVNILYLYRFMVGKHLVLKDDPGSWLMKMKASSLIIVIIRTNTV